MPLLLCILLLAASAQPDWVDSSGRAAKYPADRYLTAFAFSDGVDALAAAKLSAAAELARAISTRVESQMTDLSEVNNGSEKQQITALNKASTDVRLDGIAYETFTSGERVFALAILERAAAAGERRKLRDASVAQVRESVKTAQAAEKEKRDADAVKAWLAARTGVGEALQHETLARVIAKQSEPAWAAVESELADATRVANTRVDALLRSSHGNLKEAVEALALQLHAQGVSNKAKWDITPFTYRATIYPSIFGRQAASDLERALTQVSAGDTASGSAEELAFKGTYTEEGEQLRLIVYAREVKSGRTAASAESSFPLKAVPAELPLTPPNLMQAMRDQKILGAGEEVPGGLKVELFTNKHDATGSQVFVADEELKLFVRVNKPCWVRLVYLLQSGHKVPIAQAWYIPEANVNKLVEFTDSFQISAPFGSESIHAAAFTDKPDPLPTVKKTVEGTEYDVLTEGTQALVKQRGFKKVTKSETADAVVSITTMPK